MEFCDEHYVKLFTRDTVTWRSWGWQAKCLLPLLMRKVDHAGILSIGRLNPAHAVALMVEVPSEVAEPGLNDLLATGTVELIEGSLIISRFVEAQESRKTNAQSKRDQRERAKAQARAPKLAKPQEGTGRRRQTKADEGQSSPSPTPSSARPLLEKLAGDERPPAKPPKSKRERPPPPPPTPPDPRFTPLRDRLERECAGYRFGAADAKPLKNLLTAHGPDEVAARLARAYRRTGYPTVRTVLELERMWPHFATDSPGVVPRDAQTQYPDGYVKL